MNKKSLRLNTSPLAYDYMYAFDKVRDFYSGDFRRLEEFSRHAELASSRVLDRVSLAKVLSEQNRDYGCGSPTLKNIEMLARDRTYAVVTGQQVGLFSGPLYTIYKSLTAIKLAEFLNQNLTETFVPVFWLASDDHDLAEIDHINLLAEDNRVEKIQYRPPDLNKKIPASRIRLTEKISDCMERLDELTRDSEFKPKVLERLQEAYHIDRSYADAFGRWMTQLFGTYGLVFIDASHPRLKEMGKNVFFHEVSGKSPLTERALQASHDLKQAGYHSQVRLHEGILNLFYAEEERQPIHSKADGFNIKGKKQFYSRNGLLDLLDEKPEMFSPNVLLRPLYQDALLPTVAYVGGPGEIAYFAQLKDAYVSFGLTMPLIYPRKSVSVMENNIHHIMQKYGMGVGDVWRNADGMINEIAKKQIPGSIDRALRIAESHVEQDVQHIKSEVKVLDPTLEKSADHTLGKIKKQLQLLEKKIVLASKKQNSITVRQLEKVKNSLYPAGHLQERIFNIVPYLIKYDFAMLDRLYRAIDMDDHDHQVIEL